MRRMVIQHCKIIGLSSATYTRMLPRVESIGPILSHLQLRELNIKPSVRIIQHGIQFNVQI